MSGRRTLFFVLIAGILAIFYYAKLHKPATGPMSAFSPEVAQSFVLDVPAHESVNRLSFYDRSKDSTIIFEKDSKNSWHIVSPVHFPAEPLIVDGFVTLLKRTPRLRPLSTHEVDLKDFGFDQPKLKICVGISKHKDRCLLIGGNSVIGQGAYAKWEDEAAYFLLEEIFLKSFDKTLYSIRRKQIFHLLDGEISEIRFESAKKKINLVHSGKHWIFPGRVESAI